MSKNKTRAVVLDLCQNSYGYLPGETVTALLQVSGYREPIRSADSDLSSLETISLDDVIVECVGVERVDTSWVSKEYRKGVASLTTDSRRVQRHVIHGKLRAATEGGFGDQDCRVFVVRFDLPEWIPPTFKGMTVRYTYFVDVSVGYMFDGQNFTETLRQSIHVWPKIQNSDFHDNISDPVIPKSLFSVGVPTTHGMTATHYNDKSDRHRSVKITCWEVGAGTTIDDAIVHVESLKLESQNSTPYSPAYQGERLSRSSSLDTKAVKGLDVDSSPADFLKKKLFSTPNDKSWDHRKRVVSVIPESDGAEVKNPIASGTGVTTAKPSTFFDGVSGSVSFKLRVEDRPLATIHIHSSQYIDDDLAPGKSIIGTIEFPETPSSIRCLKYVVALELDETIAEQWRAKGKSAASGGVVSQTVDETVQLSADTVSSYFMFSLPSDSTPNFSTDLITLRYGLRFYFYIKVSDEINIKMVEWKIPLKVHCPL